MSATSEADQAKHDRSEVKESETDVADTTKRKKPRGRLTRLTNQSASDSFSIYGGINV